MKQKILSIITAQPGWVSTYDHPDGTVAELPVAVWAIVEDEDGRITGFSQTDSTGFFPPDDELGNFAGWRMATPDITFGEEAF